MESPSLINIHLVCSHSKTAIDFLSARVVCYIHASLNWHKSEWVIIQREYNVTMYMRVEYIIKEPQ
jgi:hypothetical protein